MASGDRLAEAGKINVSLMTLKKCLDVRRFNASTGTADGCELVPYNESKITRLFQPALEGGAKTIMVVCIDPYEHADVDALSRASMAGPSLSFTETRNVLDFARVASELVASVRRVEDPAPLPPPPKMLLAGASDEDEEDEVFFDTDAEGEAEGALLGRSRKRAGVDVGVQTDAVDEEEEEDAEPKRQRRDLGGGWQHPAAPPSSTDAKPMAAEAARVADMASSGVGGMTALSRDAAFSFEAPPPTAMLGGGTGDTAREMSALRAALALAQQQARRAQAERAAETDELVAYAEALEAGVAQLRGQWAAAQERALRIEEETRAEAAAFFMGKLAALKRAAADRLADELARGEERAAHKIDILSRLRPAPCESSDDESGAEVPTVSPRTAVRRAVSRAASKKANKVASVSAGEHSELARLRALAESLDAQVQAKDTELEFNAQARAADRDRRETLEAALVDATERAAAAEARARSLAAANAAAADLAGQRQRERERAELLAQIAMLRAQLRDAETLARAARRAWETHELLPVQERLRVLLAAHAAAQAGESPDEAVERACRDRDSAWAWWTREQERCAQLSAQNDVLMREIRHLRASAGVAADPHVRRAPSVVVESAANSSADDDGDDDDDDGFCKISLRSVASASAINGGDSLAPPSMISDLDRVASKARVLVRVPKPPQTQSQLLMGLMPPPRESSDSLRQASPPGGGGRAKRVVSRVIQHFAPDGASASSSKSRPPYLAGRFANTDTAVGCYSAEVFSYEDSGGPPPAGRPRGATTESLDTAAAPKVRSIVYSGPIVSHATGGVSVTFTSQAVCDLPLATTAEHIPEEDEELELSDHHRGGRS
ncbi:Kinesin-like protein kif23, partial [Coemansia sp. RSA 1836]